MTSEAFKKLFIELFGAYDEESNEIQVEIDTCEGIYFCGITDEDVCAALSKHFDATVTSVHLDHFLPTGVWICFEN